MESICDDCPICFLKITNKYITICNHNFCSECIHNWLVNHNNCPICRKIIKQTTGKKIINDTINDLNLYQYSFALYPENNHPAGSVNISRIDNTSVELPFNRINSNEHYINNIFSNYNIEESRQPTNSINTSRIDNILSDFSFNTTNNNEYNNIHLLHLSRSSNLFYYSNGIVHLRN